MSAPSGRPRLPAEHEHAFWTALRQGHSTDEAAAAVGVSPRQGRQWLYQRGGVMPPADAGPSTQSLSFAEREEIALLRAQEAGVREIGRHLGRDPGTISRELGRVPSRNRHGPRYRASTAQAHADALARRPKPAKLETNPRLHAEVQDRLKRNHSPEQIAHRLREDYPDDTEMRVSHETIYQAIY